MGPSIEAGHRDRIRVAVRTTCGSAAACSTSSTAVAISIGDSRLLTVVYGYRPAALRTEAGKPDLRFFVEATAEDRGAISSAGLNSGDARTVFVGPTSLLLHKAIGVEAGVLFPAYQCVSGGFVKERVRIAVNVAYFFWLK